MTVTRALTSRSSWASKTHTSRNKSDPTPAMGVGSFPFRRVVQMNRLVFIAVATVACIIALGWLSFIGWAVYTVVSWLVTK
jgi:hypothetical protein